MKAWEDDAIYAPRSEASKGTNPIDALVSDFQPPEVWDGQFWLGKPRPLPRLWDFVTAAWRPRHQPERLIQWSGASQSWSCFKRPWGGLMGGHGCRGLKKESERR